MPLFQDLAVAAAARLLEVARDKIAVIPRRIDVTELRVQGVRAPRRKGRP